MSDGAICPAQRVGRWTGDSTLDMATLKWPSGSVVLEQLLAAVETAGDVVGLALRAHRRCVRGEVAGRGDEEEAVAGQRELAIRGLDGLDRVEVAILAKERAAERGLELP